MMNAPLVSVIVPVFNVGPYLARCLASIAEQTERRLEILVIDDGSTDDSRAIADDYAAGDARFSVYSKANGGQGLARNFALDRARGKYIAFVDGDDWIEPEAYAHCVELLEASEADFVNFGLNFVTAAGEEKAVFGQYRQTSLQGEQLVRHALIDDQVFSSPCNKMYRRTTLDAGPVRFPSVRACEDIYFSRILSLMSRKAIFTSNIYYHALIRSGSTTRKMSSATVVEACKALVAEREFFTAAQRMAEFEVYFRAHIVKFFGYMLVLAAFRIRDWADFRRCIVLAEELGFSRYRTDAEVLAKLSRRGRAIAWLCGRPRLLRTGAWVARKLKWSPY